MNDVIEKLSDISIRLTAEKDVHKLLELILNESIDITGCDAGSIYIVQEAEDIRKLVFKYTKNQSMSFPFKEFELPINNKSISGACACTGQIFNFKTMEDTQCLLGIQHNKSFDESYGYETCNMLVIPLKNFSNEIIGVLQLINKKVEKGMRFEPYSKNFSQYVTAFDEQDERIISALASQAAILIKRNMLFKDIENLLHSVIEAMVAALDSRDPITAGHSKRVTKYALRLGEAINRSGCGSLSEEQLKELNIACLLHDVGKIGVRENVLMKRSKLTDDNLDAVRSRIRWVESMLLLKQERKTIDEAEAVLLEEISKHLEDIENINKSGFLSEEMKSSLERINSITFKDLDGKVYKLINDKEYENLGVQRGNLTERERDEINSHVRHSYNMLKEISWTKALSKVPKIAGSHHEKLNGMGYPFGLKSEEIDLCAKILAIADIYDALTARDRPYKPALPIDKSLGILRDEAARNSLDPELVELFIAEKAYLLEE